MSVQWCDTATGLICSTPSDTFPFWEVSATAVITALVTWITIRAATRSARDATEKSLEQARELHTQSIEAAERQANYQTRMSEATTIGRAARAHFSVLLRGDDPGSDSRAEDLSHDARATLSPSLTPAAPQLLRVVMFELEVAPLKSDVDVTDEDALWEWENDALERRDRVLERIDDWARDPDEAAERLIQDARRVALIGLSEAAFGMGVDVARKRFEESEPD